VYKLFYVVLWLVNIHSAVIMAEPLREFTRFTRWIQNYYTLLFSCYIYVHYRFLRFTFLHRLPVHWVVWPSAVLLLCYYYLGTLQKINCWWCWGSVYVFECVGSMRGSSFPVGDARDELPCWHVAGHTGVTDDAIIQSIVSISRHTRGPVGGRLWRSSRSSAWVGAMPLFSIYIKIYSGIMWFSLR